MSAFFFPILPAMSAQFPFDERGERPDVLQILQLAEREAHAERALDFHDEGHVVERIPVLDVAGGGLARDRERRLPEDIAEDRREALDHVTLLHATLPALS